MGRNIIIIGNRGTGKSTELRKRLAAKSNIIYGAIVMLLPSELKKLSYINRISGTKVISIDELHSLNDLEAIVDATKKYEELEFWLCTTMTNIPKELLEGFEVIETKYDPNFHKLNA
jgi:hypothetical protein